MLKQWLTRTRFLVAPKPRHEIDEELQFHLEQLAEANVAAGMTPQEARRQAVISFGESSEPRKNLTNSGQASISKPFFRISAMPSAASAATPSLRPPFSSR